MKPITKTIDSTNFEPERLHKYWLPQTQRLPALISVIALGYNAAHAFTV
jgi:hypothetical protein